MTKTTSRRPHQPPNSLYVVTYGSHQTGAQDAMATLAQISRPENARGVRSIHRVTDGTGPVLLTPDWPVTPAVIRSEASREEARRYSGVVFTDD